METVFTIFLLIVFGIIALILQLFILNLGGVPGVLLAGKPGKRTKQRFIFGSIVSALGQSYINLAYTAFIVSWTLLAVNSRDIVEFLIWPFAFLAVILPIWITLIKARVEAKEVEYASAQTEALHITFIITFIGFILFAFVPTVMKSLWGWVPYV